MKPLLIDNRLNSFASSELMQTTFINPDNINFIEVQRATMTVSNDDDKQEIQGFTIEVNTKIFPKERYSFFCISPDFNWLETNCQEIDLSLVRFETNELSEPDYMLYINKKNIIEMFMEKSSEYEDEVNSGEEVNKILKEYANIYISFYSPHLVEKEKQVEKIDNQNPEENGQDTQEEINTQNTFVLSIKLPITEENRYMRAYDIVFDYLNHF